MSNWKKSILLLASSLFSTSLFAQAEEVVEKTPTAWHEFPFEVVAPLALFGLAFFVIFVMLVAIVMQFGITFRQQLIKDGIKDLPWLFALFGLFEGDSKVLTGEYHDQIIEGHDYDGIQEFDNNLPPWWVGMFYVTIVFAVLYMGYYTFFGGFTQKQEFDSEVAVAAAMYKDIDQVFDAPLADAAALQKAQEIFVSNCAACHKDDLGGSIGPNLTDEFWKNGGGVNEIYKTVKYGVQNTAMKSWKNEFDNDQIYAIASFILSKKGSHPEGAKQPEGEIWTK